MAVVFPNSNYLGFAFLLFFFFTVVDADPTDGFTELPLNKTVLELHKPFNLPACARYLYTNSTDLHRFWVLKTDNPAWQHPGNPRSEIRMRGYEYTTGVWQFEGHGFIPNVTTGVCIMQVFGPVNGHPTILMLKLYDCALCYYNRQIVLARNLCDRWFRLNVIHDANAAIIYIYLDGQLIKTVGNRKFAQHWFQFGVYAQENNYSDYMEVRWQGVKLLKIIDK